MTPPGRSPRKVVLAVPMAVVMLQMPWALLHQANDQLDEADALEGVVRLKGDTVALPTQVANETDPDVCGREHSLEDLVVSSDNRGIQHATIALLDVPASARTTAPSPPSRLEIDNRGCRFIPHTAVAVVGDTIVARNSDPVFHTTHYYGPLRGNVALPRSDMSVSRVVRQPGIITVLCDVHGWMKAFIRVGDHGFHDVTDESGSFAIADIPPGSYTVEFWHERLGAQQLDVQIESGRTTRVETVFSLEDSDLDEDSDVNH